MRLHKNVSTTTTEYGMVLLDESTGRYWQLSHLAALIVEQLDRGEGIDDTVELITGRFDVETDKARHDVDVFVGKLRSAGLVTS